jgi:hypothetical protein
MSFLKRVMIELQNLSSLKIIQRQASKVKNFAFYVVAYYTDLKTVYNIVNIKQIVSF